MHKPMPRALLPLLLLLTLAVHASDAMRWVALDGRRYTVEVAATEQARTKGLMYRQSMAVTHGMLFVHPMEAPQAYWMKNTHMALDILYFNRARKLVSQQRNVPPCRLGDQCPQYPSQAAALYVLELNAGQAEALQLRDGAELKFGAGIPLLHSMPIHPPAQ